MKPGDIMQDNRILLISNTFFLKAGNQSLYNTVMGLGKNGFTITIITCANGNEYLTFDEIKDSNIYIIPVYLYSQIIYRHIKNSFVIKKLTRLYKNLFSKDYVTPRNTYTDNQSNFSNDHNQWKSIVALLEFMIRTRLILKKHVRYDVLWGYERTGAIITNHIRRKIPHNLFITSFQGTVIYPYIGIYRKWRLIKEFPLEYFSHKINADLIIMTNDGTQGDKVLETFGHNKANIIFIPNGVQINNYSQDIAINNNIMGIISKNKYTFVTASRLVTWKRIDRSIEVFKELLTLEPESHLIIVGDGPEKQNIELLIDKYSLSNNITLTGFLSHQSTLQVMKNASMLFSFCDFSNMTNSIQEAAYLNIPVATINDGSTNSVLTEQNSVKANISEGFAREISSKIILFLENSDRNRHSNKITFTWDERMNTISYEIRRRLQSNKRDNFKNNSHRPGT